MICCLGFGGPLESVEFHSKAWPPKFTGCRLMDGNVDELAVDSRRGSKGSGRSCVGFEPVRDERRPSQEREVCFGSTSTTRAILFTYLSLDGPSTRWADPGRLISLCFSGRQFA